MTPDQLQSLRIPEEAKIRSQKPVWTIFLFIGLAAAGALFYAWPRERDKVRTKGDKVALERANKTNVVATSGGSAVPVSTNNLTSPASATNGGASVLTVSGYIVNRERIELSPRFMGVVNWIGVKKGDAVTNGQVVVLLDDSEYKARAIEARGHLEVTKANLDKAETAYARTALLAKNNIESKQLEDDARILVAAAKAGVQEAEGQFELIKTYIGWCTIRSPINGVVLEKLVDPNELVTPQSFGGGKGPSTALIAVADPKDLQVEIDLNETDVAKVFLNQACRVSPEAYPDRAYDGYVAEKAPEANRQKGTLQVKVQIKNPDAFLTPELSAKVDFIGGMSNAEPK